MLACCVLAHMSISLATESRTRVLECVQGYVDVAQHREWVETTGGTIYLYHPFHPTLDYDELLNDLLWNVRREQGLEALLRVRCSSGIDVDSYHGAFLKRETGVSLANTTLAQFHCH
jgi:Sec23/Sec24 trunk domain